MKGVKNMLTYKDITKIKLNSKGFFLNGEKLSENGKLEEFTFIDKDGRKQIANQLFYMMGEGHVIIAKDTDMRSFIQLYDFLENQKINFKEQSRLELEEKWEKERIEEQKRKEERNKLENNRRPMESLEIGQTRYTTIEEGTYKQLKYKIILYEDYYSIDEYILEIETKNCIYSRPFLDIKKLRDQQKEVLEEYSNQPEAPGIFDLFIGSYQGTNKVIVQDMKEFQDILKHNKKKYNTTYDIRVELLKLKFKWQPKKNEWEYEAKTKEEVEKLITTLKKKYQNEYPEKKLLGVHHCYECGCAFYQKHNCG